MQKSHHPRKRHLKVSESRSDSCHRNGVRIAPKQSAKHLCHNLENSSLEKQIDPALVECVRFKVLTWQGLDCGDGVSSP